MTKTNMYTQRTIAIAVHPPGEQLFSEQTTLLKLDDEAAGEYIKIQQQYDEAEAGTIIIDNKHEWEAISDAVKTLQKNIQPYDDQ